MTNTELLEFPCEFAIKVMGKNSIEFEGMVIAIFNKHFSDLSEAAVKSRTSKADKYISLTVTVNANSKEQLDAIYQELSDCDQVLYCI